VWCGRIGKRLPSCYRNPQDDARGPERGKTLRKMIMVSGGERIALSKLTCFLGPGLERRDAQEEKKERAAGCRYTKMAAKGNGSHSYWQVRTRRHRDRVRMTYGDRATREQDKKESHGGKETISHKNLLHGNPPEDRQMGASWDYGTQRVEWLIREGYPGTVDVTEFPRKSLSLSRDQNKNRGRCAQIN